jgi:hypothetical protein
VRAFTNSPRLAALLESLNDADEDAVGFSVLLFGDQHARPRLVHLREIARVLKLRED